MLVNYDVHCGTCLWFPFWFGGYRCSDWRRGRYLCGCKDSEFYYKVTEAEQFGCDKWLPNEQELKSEAEAKERIETRKFNERTEQYYKEIKTNILAGLLWAVIIIGLAVGLLYIIIPN